MSLVILLVAFGLRCGTLDAQELRGDEAFGYFFSLPALFEIVEQTLELGEPHPVASYWLQHLWLDVAGHSEFALRFVGVWWSVLAAALMLPLAAQLGLPVATGIVGAALMALSPYVIWHAQDARMYNMSLALTLASSLLAVQWWRGDDYRIQFRLIFAYLLVTWLALNTHYFALYVVVAQNLALAGWAIAARSWRKLLLWWGCGVLLLLMWLPWLLHAWTILFDYRGNGDSPDLLDAMVRAQSTFVVGETVSISVQPWWATLTLAALGVGLVALWQREQVRVRRAAWFLVVYWLTPLLATWLSAQSRPIFNERYLVAAVPPVYLLIAAAAGKWPVGGGQNWQVWLGRGLIVAVLVGMVLGFVRQQSDPLYSKTRGWRELSAALEPLSSGIDPARVRLVQNYPDPTLWYYYQGDVPHLALPPAPRDLIRSREEVEQLVAEDVGRIVLVEQPAASWDPGGIAQDALSTAYTRVASRTVANWTLSVWIRPVQALEYTVDTLRDFGAGLPDTELFFITGADAILNILTWKDAGEALKLASFVAATRPGYDLATLEEHDLTRHVTLLDVPALAISSSDVRERFRADRPVRYLIPREVEEYARKHGLYGTRGRGLAAASAQPLRTA